MKAYLIYTAYEAARNEWFAKRFIELGKSCGIDFSLLIWENISISFCGGKAEIYYKGEKLPAPDFVVNRTQDHLLSLHFENAGVRVFNSSEVSRICNNKMLTFELAATLGLPFMDTAYHESTSDDITLPAVLKPLDGKGGRDVVLVKDREELEAALPIFAGRPFLSQRVASDVGRDHRIYVMGGRVMASFLRFSDSDFRSNYGINGNAEPLEPDAFELEAIDKIVSVLHPDFVGIDFIFDGGRPVFNEIEDCVGSRMVYRYTDIDAADEYIKHILRSL